MSGLTVPGPWQASVEVVGVSGALCAAHRPEEGFAAE